MNATTGPRRRKWSRIARGTAVVFAVAFVSLLGFGMWEYFTWRNKMIEWDFGTIELLCGGDTEDDRLLDIRFVKKWEYKALKKTTDGKPVWLRWKLTKRHCGNWMLIEKPLGVVIRPYELRFPNGAPHRQGVSCLGTPTDSASWIQRREAAILKMHKMFEQSE